MIWHPPAIFVGPATNISLIFRRANRSLTCSLLSCVCHSCFFGFVLLNKEELEPTDYGSVPMEHGVRLASASTLSHTPNQALGSLCTLKVLREGDSIRRYGFIWKWSFFNGFRRRSRLTWTDMQRTFLNPDLLVSSTPVSSTLHVFCPRDWPMNPWDMFFPGLRPNRAWSAHQDCLTS